MWNVHPGSLARDGVRRREDTTDKRACRSPDLAMQSGQRLTGGGQRKPLETWRESR